MGYLWIPMVVQCLITTALVAEEMGVKNVIPIVEARADLNGDYVPDRLGDTVTVAGRATVGTGVLHRELFQIFVQDGSGGINVFARETTQPVKQGDSVIVTGTIRQYNGLTQLDNPTYVVLKTERRVPEPLELKSPAANWEQYESMLIRVRGNVVNKGRNQGGQYVIVSIGDDILSIFVSNFHYPTMSLDKYQPGDQVEVTGILGQYDFTESLNGYYQLYPLFPSDIKSIGFTRSMYRNALIAIGIFFLGGIFWIIALAINIKKRKQVEVSLRESEEKYRSLVENAEDAIYILQDNKFVVVNAAFEKMFGYTSEEAAGESFNFLKLVSPESIELIKHRADAREEGEAIPSQYEFSAITKSGETLDLQTNTSAIEYMGKPAVHGILRNITEQKSFEKEKIELEKKLVRAKRMESLGILAGGVAHDLNNTLVPILGLPDLILLNLSDEDAVSQQVKVIKKSAERAADIIDDLLTLARRGRYEMTPLDLNGLVNSYVGSSLLEDMKRTYPNVVFESTLDGDCLDVLGSGPHITKLLMNLIINAFEAMPHGGTLRVSTLNKYVDTQLPAYDVIEEGDYVALEISDQGYGIEEENLQKIFEPFYSKKNIGKSGTGLGLAVVYGVMKDHSGFIDVSSEVGKGTTFTMYFPVTREELISAEDGLNDYRGKETLLIVDDIDSQREVATSILSSLGYNALSVGNAHAAVDYLREKPVDLVIIDMIMEDDLDGLDTYREICKVRPHQKAIILSGFAETERVKKAQQLGVGKYIKKPYTLEEIGYAVREELDRK